MCPDGVCAKKTQSQDRRRESNGNTADDPFLDVRDASSISDKLMFTRRYAKKQSSWCPVLRPITVPMINSSQPKDHSTAEIRYEDGQGCYFVQVSTQG